MNRVIAIINQKGGVGKTTSTIELAYGIARKFPQQKVLCIDLDAQRNASGVFLKSIQFEKNNSSFDLFTEKLSSRHLHPTNVTNLLCVPGVLELVEIEAILSGKLDGFFRLQDNLKEAKKEFQWIFIDCPPSLNLVTINALVFSTEVLMPMVISKFSIDGIQSILDAIDSVKRRYNPQIKILGGLITMYDARTSLSNALVPEIQKHLPIFKTKIPKSVVVEEAHLLQQDLFQYAPKHKVTIAYEKLIEEISLKD